MNDGKDEMELTVCTKLKICISALSFSIWKQYCDSFLNSVYNFICFFFKDMFQF